MNNATTMAALSLAVVASYAAALIAMALRSQQVRRSLMPTPDQLEHWLAHRMFD